MIRPEITEIFPTIYSTLHPEAILRLVSSSYDIEPPLECEFIHRGLNDVYSLHSENQSHVLRACRAGARSMDQVTLELELLDFLQSQEIRIAVPKTARDGRRVKVVTAPEGARLVVLFSYAPGRHLRLEREDAAAFGRAVARIHAVSPPQRISSLNWLDVSSLIGEPLELVKPLLLDRLMRREDWDYVQVLAAKLQTGLSELPLGALDWGFCHGDCHTLNAHIEGSVVTVFDFEHSGQGWRAYDLATFRWTARHFGLEKSSWPAFLDGYREQRTLSDLDIQATDYFLLARQLWIMGLHARNAAEIGYGRLGNHYFDHSLDFLRSWETQHLA